MKIPTESDIIALLETKHSKDIFVSKCKTGSTWFTTGYGILDAWVMPRSWRNFITKGYEVKVSRSDFVNDTKWRKYLEYCHEFYFVAPPGVIDKSELPTEAGLLVTSVNFKRLYTKKKAPYREIEIPSDLFIYILMTRVRILSTEYEWDAKKYFENWLKKKELDENFGWRVSKAIRERIEEEITKVRDKQKRLDREIEGFKDIKAACEKLNIDPAHIYSFDAENQIKKGIAKLNLIFPEGFAGYLDKTIKNFQRLQELIQDADNVQSQKLS